MIAKYRRVWVAEMPTRPATKKSRVYFVCKPKPIAQPMAIHEARIIRLGAKRLFLL
jgi:hypothetical protein